MDERAEQEADRKHNAAYDMRQRVERLTTELAASQRERERLRARLDAVRSKVEAISNLGSDDTEAEIRAIYLADEALDIIDSTSPPAAPVQAEGEK